MNGITISRSALRDACKMVAGSIKGKATLPILDCTLVSLDETKGFCLRATDMVLDITAYVDTEAVDSPWEPCLLNTRMFTEMVDKFDGDEIVLMQKGKEITLKSSGCKGRLVRMEVNEFPAEPDMSNAKNCAEIPINDFTSVISKVEFAAMKVDSSRPVLERICIIPSDENTAYVLALDGFRAERRSLSLPNNEITGPILLNADKLAVVNSALGSSNAEILRMSCTDTWCAFDAEDKVSIRLRKYNEEPVNTAPLFKPVNEQSTVIRLRRHEMLAAVQRAVMFSTSTSSVIKVDIADNAVIVYASSADGDISSTVDALVNKRGTLDRITFNARYLIDCLNKGWRGVEEIDMGLNTSVTPMIVSGVGSDDMDMSLVLPVRSFG